MNICSLESHIPKCLLLLVSLIVTVGCGGGGGGSGITATALPTDWTQPVLAASDFALDSSKSLFSKQIAISDTGAAVVSFIQKESMQSSLGTVNFTNTVVVTELNSSSGKWSSLNRYISAAIDQEVEIFSLRPNVGGDFRLFWGVSRLGIFDTDTHFSLYTDTYSSPASEHRDLVIDAETGKDASRPTIAFGPDGEGIVLWWERLASSSVFSPQYGLFVREYSPSSGWTIKQRLTDTTVNSKQYGLYTWAAVDGLGVKHVAFTDIADDRLVSISGSGTTWTEKTRFENTRSGDLVMLKADASGNVMLLWRNNDSSDKVTRYAYKRHNEAWGTPSILYTESINDDLGPQLAMSKNGDAIVVWLEANIENTNVVVWARRWLDGAWLPAEVISGSMVRFFENDFSPVIAMNDFGDAVVAWHRIRAGVEQPAWAVATGYSKARGWRKPERVSLVSQAGPSVDLSVAMSPNGKALVSWRTNISSPSEHWVSFKNW